jgi:phosphoglycerate dehydrogenase-like enzyme
MNILLMYPPSEQHAAELHNAAPAVRFVVAHDEDSAAALIVDADAVLGNRYFLQSLPFARRLRWMQSNSMGVDLIVNGGGALLDHVILTSAKGVYRDEVADHALALLLGVSRGLWAAHEAYQRREWGRWSLPTLDGCSALVIGWGASGQAIGRRLLGFGVRVQGVRRTHTGQPAPDDTGCIVHGVSTWRTELPDTDILVLAAPFTPETHALIGTDELAALPPHAILINIARGQLVDETALFAALHAGRLFGAGLDTLAEEPPSPDHPVWTTPRLLLTPHVARSLEQGTRRWESLFVENVRRFAAGEPLLNVVDKGLGY